MLALPEQTGMSNRMTHTSGSAEKNIARLKFETTVPLKCQVSLLQISKFKPQIKKSEMSLNHQHDLRKKNKSTRRHGEQNL